MKMTGLIFVRISLALLGAVAMYVLLYAGSAWLADQVGYENAFGRGLGFVNGALSPMGWGYIAIALLAVVIFLILSKFAFRRTASSE
jgi:hypothetical protein